MRRERRGAHAVEFALLMPVFLMMMLGCVEYTWMSYRQSALTSAADAGCRSGSLVDPGIGEVNMANVESAASAAMISVFDTRGPGCHNGCSTSIVPVGARPYRSIRCSITLEYVPMTGLLPTPESLTATAIVRLEFQRG